MATAASTAAPLTPIERGSDWLNPILVKETRQSLKSRQFVATFMLMLVASWLISVFGILLSGAGAEYRTLGGTFFFAYYVVLAVAVFIVVPFGAFRSLLSERDLHTWEVLSITTLKPRQIVWGKLLSSLVQIFIYYSAITPFMAFAVLLKGVDVPTIAFILVASLFWSMALSMIGLTISTFGSQRYWQVFLTLAMLGGLLLSLFFSLSLVGQGMLYFEFDSPEFWWGTAVVASLLGAYCVLLLQVAIGQLTFDADNRTTSVRLAAAGVFWLAVAWVYAGTSLHGLWGIPAPPPSADISDFLVGFTILAAIHWFVIGLFTVTEIDVLSRRVRRNVGRFGVFRVFLAPLVPGGARGYLYLLFHLAVLFAFVACLLWLNPSSANTERAVYFTAALVGYLVIYLGLGSAVGGLARRISGDFRPAHARVMTVLILALGSILPYFLYLFEGFRAGQDQSPQFWITDPFSTLYRLLSGHADSNLLLLLIAAGATVTLAINLRGMLSSVIDVVRSPLPGLPLPSRPTPPGRESVPVAAG
jgi:hypothetical protein